MQNAVPRLRVAVSAKLEEILGTPTDPFTEVAGAGLDYLLAQDYQRKQAEYHRAQRPVVTVHMRQVVGIVDASQFTGLPAYVNFDIRVRQGLIDQGAAGYTHHTANRLWDIADFIAGRFHRENLVPGAQIGVTEVVDISPLEEETQERLGALTIVIRCRARMHINAQRSLDSDQDFREFFGTTDLGTIDTASLTVEVDGEQVLP